MLEMLTKCQVYAKKVRIVAPERIYEVDFSDEANRDSMIHELRCGITNCQEVIQEFIDKYEAIEPEEERFILLEADKQIISLYDREHKEVIDSLKSSYRESRNFIALYRKQFLQLKQFFFEWKIDGIESLSNLLVEWSEKIKEIVSLKNSQQSFRNWNDTYRVQQKIVIQLLINEAIDPEVIDKVNKIYKTKSVNKAVDIGCDFLNLEKSEIIKMVKTVVHHTKLK
ncbi:hypothetical protein IQ225_07070 [Synechocystis salina LEGE 06155]|nr:hypothetical protein [Synechocystis salina LEGE 06155]